VCWKMRIACNVSGLRPQPSSALCKIQALLRTLAACLRHLQLTLACAYRMNCPSSCSLRPFSAPVPELQQQQQKQQQHNFAMGLDTLTSVHTVLRFFISHSAP
jgi:hypothetical protein